MKNFLTDILKNTTLTIYKYFNNNIMTGDLKHYNSKFYRRKWRKENAEIILSSLLKVFPHVKSAIDFGCGIGVWLSAMKNLGVEQIQGYDGHWVDKNQLVIPKECFTEVDLDSAVDLNKKYDLAISIEVAEHLPENSAEMFVETLTKASDIVLFSAAIPYQRGQNHVNEQWQDYWYNIFQKFDYEPTNIIRSIVWDNDKIAAIYKQNMVLYVKKEKIKELNISDEYFDKTTLYLNVVHPEMWSGKLEKEGVYKISMLRLYRITLKRTAQKILGFWGVKIF